MVQVRDLLEELWRRTFRIVDDMKESVAASGVDLAKALMTLTCRLCQEGEGAGQDEAKEVLGVVLPLLLQSGITSASKVSE